MIGCDGVYDSVCGRGCMRVCVNGYMMMYVEQSGIFNNLRKECIRTYNEGISHLLPIDSTNHKIVHGCHPP